jgi:polysaccharide biosynthesis protein PslH
MAKVLGLVSFRVYPTHMGGQKGVALFYEYLQRYAEVLLAVSTDNVDTNKLQLQRVLFPNKKIYRNISKIGELEAIIKTNEIDVIIAEHSYTAWMASLLKKRTGRPFVIHSHNIESKRFQKMNKWWWKLYNRYEAGIHRKADYNFFISQEDQEFAIEHFKLDRSKCEIITYGIEDIPQEKDKAALRKKLGLDSDKSILLFNGTLDYEPNYEAVEKIIDELNPLLKTKLSNYQVVITGNRAPKELAKKMLAAGNLIYTGYVDDVNAYYQAADVFINPVANDSGVKTKLIEAIANHCTTVSTFSGASGIAKELCGDKLHLVPDDSSESFIDKIVECLSANTNGTPQAFFDHYSWENICLKAAKKIEAIVKK